MCLHMIIMNRIEFIVENPRERLRNTFITFLHCSAANRLLIFYIARF